MAKSGWENLPNTNKGYTYYYPKYNWWQFIKKRKFANKIKQIQPGTRIKFRKPMTFSDDFVIQTVIEVRKEDK